MELEEKIKILAESRVFGISKLIHIGGSYGLTLPKRWVEVNMTEIDGDYYCEVEVVGNTIVFRPIDPSEIESVTIKEKE
jgi:hypothetical protein